MPLSAWYMDNEPGDQRLEHMPHPSEEVSLDVLKSLGVLYWQLNGETDDPALQGIKSERNYNYEDIITVSPDKLENYETKIKYFYEEHLHSDEEIRYILEGSGYFDVRDKGNRWIRIAMGKGDMIILPAGIYHRFTLDTKNYIKAMRLFKGEPVWTPINRPADSHPARIQYMTDHS